MAKVTHTIDATGIALGRLASKTAVFLRGKDQPDYAPHIDSGVTVKIVNADKMLITGTKLDKTIYLRHSGYPGGQKKTVMSKLVERKGKAEVIRTAVKGMLPANRLRAQFMKRLIIKD